jgi:DNA-binding LacI/PurR family transcriptional regulator
MATINDVAKKACVSKATVSRVLNNISVVNPKTKQRVLDAINELNYTPSFLAKGMRRKKTNTFGVIIPDFRNLYYSELLNVIEDEARFHNYIAIICTGEMNGERERGYIEYLLSRQVEGLILCCYVNIIENKSLIKKVAKKVPIIVMDQPSCNLPVSAVYADGYKGFKVLVSYLIEMGHKKIGMIRSLSRYPCSESRFFGYVDALKEHGFNIDMELIEESEFTASGGYEAAKRLLAKSKPTAIVGVNDIVAIGAMKFILEKGYSVPDDIALAGFDNIALSSLVSPQLTTMSIPIEKIAHKAINQLILRIQNPRAKNRDIVLETELIVRQSTEYVTKDKIRM